MIEKGSMSTTIIIIVNIAIASLLAVGLTPLLFGGKKNIWFYAR